MQAYKFANGNGNLYGLLRDPPTADGVLSYIESRRVTKETKEITGDIEIAIKRAALSLDLTVYYHLIPFPVNGVLWHRPDFIFPQIQTEDNRWKLLDPHKFKLGENGKAADWEIKVFTGFHSVWGGYFDDVLVTPRTRSTIEEQLGVKQKEFADEILQIPHYYNYKKAAGPIREYLQEEIRKNKYVPNPDLVNNGFVDCVIKAREMLLQKDMVATSVSFGKDPS